MPRTTKPGDGATDQPTGRRQAQNKQSNGGANARTKGGNGAANGASTDEIERRAYEIYQARGAQHGNDIDHWLEAERQLKPGPTSVTGSIPAARPKKGKKSEAGA